jgi:hypothetical protein
MDDSEILIRRIRLLGIVFKALLGAALGFGFVKLARAAPACECVSSDWYASETLPFASAVTDCPDWPAYAPGATGRSGSTQGPAISAYRGELFLSQKAIPYADDGVKTVAAVIGGKREDCQEHYRVADQALSGWYLIPLTRWYSSRQIAGVVSVTYTRLDRGVLAALPGTRFIPLEDAEAEQVQAFFRTKGSGAAPRIPGIGLGSFPKGFLLSGGPDPVYTPGPRPSGRSQAFYVDAATLLNDIRNTLNKNGWTQFEVGWVQVEGRWWPSVLKRYGQPGTVYAYYGRFKDGEQAKKYGFTPTDELYFSARELVPDQASEIFESDLRYGSKILLREQVPKNRRQVEWHTECRCSDMTYEPDARNAPKVDKNGNWTPIAADNMENQNPPLFRDCPDHRTYFSMYRTCVEEQLKEDKPMTDLKGRVDYSDYLSSKMGEKAAYKSMNPDGTLEGEGLSVDAMPETPAYYDHAGERLNPTGSDNMDPLDPNTVFYGFRYGPKSLTDWEGSKEKQYRIDPIIKAVLADVQDLFDNKVSQGKEALLGLFDISFEHPEGNGAGEGGDALTGPLDLHAAYKSLDLTLTLDNPNTLDQPMRILNPMDKYLEFKSARTFIMQSLTGKPLKVRDWVDGQEVDDYVLGSDLDDLHFQVYWFYGIYAIDRHGDPTQVGILRVANTFWINKDHSSMKLVGKWTDEIHMEGGKLLSSADVYDLKSREAHTDLKSLHDRDPETFEDKADAMARIAFYIAVSEGLDMAMKWIYDQKDRPYIYEAAKRVENMVAVKQTAKLAYAFYKGYVEWRRLMDILAEIRDSRRALERAYSRFKRSGSLLMDHFVNLDYSKIRPTNITEIYPTRAIRYFDWSSQDLKNELVHFEASLHALNLDLDRFMDGPGKRTLAYMYRETGGSWAQVTVGNDRERERTHGALKQAQAALGRGGDNTSNYLRLSSLTRLALQKTRNTEVKSLEASTSGLRNVLIAVQSDSRDWLTMQDYLGQNLAGSPGAFLKAYRDNDPDAVARQFDVHPVFRNPWVDAHVEGNPQ